MTTPTQYFLTAFARLAENPREQGDLFERLTKEWLQNVPDYQQQFEQVYLWKEFAAQQNIDRTDIGIDLVARTHDGNYCAIQCKFFHPEHKLQKADIDSFFTASGQTYGNVKFSERKIVSTTAEWSQNAEAALANQQIECTRLDFAAELDAANIDWQAVRNLLPWHVPENQTTKRRLMPIQKSLYIEDRELPAQIDLQVLLEKLLPKKRQSKSAIKQLRPHQQQAVQDVVAGFENADRGKLIMACGTGKTFTALKIAEKLAPDGGNVLFLVPSLALLSQTLHEWSAESERPLRNFAVCSDTKVAKNNEDISVYDLAIPATTDGKKLANKLKQAKTNRTNVVFATYHSIDVVIAAQEQGAPAFDLIICDEAHRTTGVETKDKEQSYFTKVHEAKHLSATKRLYMTATPRIYSQSAKVKAKEHDVDVFSMDDPEKYGEEFHRLDFSDAVGKGLLSDYKVLILAVAEEHVSKAMQAEFAAEGELNLNDAVKIIGCWNGLAKQITNAEEGGITDTAPMRRAVAFTQTVKASKQIAGKFDDIVQEYRRRNPQENVLQCAVTHVDGTQNALIRNQALHWLKQKPQDNSCHILSNVRCLSEGVDVPALDAVMFLNPRKSQVDIVQSVGRVMRKAEGKDYGYIILPIGVAADVRPEEALQDNEKYRVVWDVLQALRAHDNRFNAEINKIELNNKQSEKINVIGVGFPVDSDSDSDEQSASAATPTGIQDDIFHLEEWRAAIYAKMVLKCGDRRYWESWAKDVAEIASRNTVRIKSLVADSETNYRELFEEFLAELRQNLNPAVVEEDAIEMLSQHMVTRPVFNALFGNNDFAAKNPISKTMQSMLELLDEQNLAHETDSLEKFYDSVQQRAEGIDNAAGKQKIIVELYDKFFRTAFPKMAERLGIAYTPVEVVDFIIHGVDDLLKKEFGKGMTAKDVHILDPFTGTGTFITRLLQSGAIDDKDMKRKYEKEIHANEIVLLAYYIAAINIEQVYHHSQTQGTASVYQPFEGIALTDTFQINERDDDILDKIFPVNSKRVQRQKSAPIRVVFGNPPYSAWQRSENDSNKNLSYKKLDQSIGETYAKYSSATLKNSLYDSYIRAIRWASDRIGDEGIIAFVTNGNYIDGNATDGLRKCLYEEFNSIYCLNLRGNIRKNMQNKSAMEGGNIFGSASMAGIAILFLIKKSISPKENCCTLYYYDIGDGLSQQQKLDQITEFHQTNNISWQIIAPNQHHDWINQRHAEFQNYLPLGDKLNKNKKGSKIDSVFNIYSNGVKTNRDAWVYNFSEEYVSKNMRRMISFYNNELNRYQKAKADNTKSMNINTFVNNDPTKISWSSTLKNFFNREITSSYHNSTIRLCIYRPFSKQYLYFDKIFIDRPAIVNRDFPTKNTKNLVICVSGTGIDKDFSALMVDCVPNLHFLDSSQCFPRYTYEKSAEKSTDFLDNADEYQRIDNIPTATVTLFQNKYNIPNITGDDIFYYVYGILHNQQYKTRFAADLKKTLPRIPYAKTAADFRTFSEAGKKLADLHINYETADPYPLLVREKDADNPNKTYYEVKKMKYAGKAHNPDKSKIIYNINITLENIPPETQQYIVNGKPALDWILDRYQITTHKASQITNNPNHWSDNPRYIINLIEKVVTVSVETVRIMDELPKLKS